LNLQEYFKIDGFANRNNDRLQRECAQMLLANLALDEAGNLLEENIKLRDDEIAKLKRLNEELVAKTTSDHALVAALRERAENAENERDKLSHQISSGMAPSVHLDRKHHRSHS
jgi:hypothetical protein